MVKKLKFEMRANRGARQAEIIKKSEDAAQYLGGGLDTFVEGACCAACIGV
jgi:hypothetical protein